MPLNKSEIAQFKLRLEELRNEVMKSVRNTKEAVTQPDEAKGYSQHSADEGTDDFVKNINLEVSNKEFGVIRQIDRALEKIEEGTYGICDISNEEIPLKRLEAIPYAAMTVKAQEKFEKGLI
ncbi:MAG: RNA polymerase-binding transcription factor [Chlamydiae bacterium CG10_big_fil_rev_8_21_14_0_10_42_34]|nr:MAG: RNA polymerase-binding transcription factor [Chlamydiae bacterium CG10_big_fil_rev_8_21_14_0_10_42_34]